MKSVMNRILIPTDYSPTAKRAAQYGLSLAKNLGSEVFVLHSFGLPVVGMAESIAIADDIRHNEGKKLDEYIGELKAEYGDVKIHGILEFGAAVEVIKHAVDSKQIDLIVMGTKGETDAANTIFGSVASHVLSQIKQPVLIVPKGHRSYSINEIMYATDFHFTNDLGTVLAPFMQLVKEYTPFVHVVKFSPVLAGQHVKNVEEMKLIELLRETKNTFHYVEADNVEEALFEFSERHHCDMMVMVTRHYTLWEKIVHRSLTKKIAMHGNLPLLVLHES